MGYNPETGQLTWLPRDVDLFSDGHHSADRNCRKWNARFASTPALASLKTGGYLHGDVFAVKVLSHRAIWAMMSGAWPSSQIDHINGIRTDNRLVNLRQATSTENNRNRQQVVGTQSGAMGVHLTPNGKWAPSIYVNGKNRHLGTFANFEDAIAARKAAERQYDFHQNHGRNPE